MVGSIRNILSSTTGQKPNRAALTYGEKDVTTAGTAVVLGGDVSIPDGFSVNIKAKAANTNKIYVGDSSVDNSDYELSAGDSVDLFVTNLNIVYIDADTNGEGVSYIVEA